MEGNLRPVLETDVERIAEIEESSFPDPWDPEMFRILARQSGRALSTTGSLIEMMVLTHRQEIVGYAVWEQKGGEGHLINLAVAGEHRSQGFGRLILEEVLVQMRKRGRTHATLEVRESNSIARHLYERAGFAASGRVVGFYGAEDAIIYSSNL